MNNRFLFRYCMIVLPLVIIGGVILYYCLPGFKYPPKVKDPTVWDIPDINALPSSPEAALIRYGKELIINTAKYLGPHGKIAIKSNGMNCQNCHFEAGTRLNGNCFALVGSTYPKYRPRSGRSESVEFRINDCMERSLNGSKLDSQSREMRAMVAYLNWLGKDVPKKAPLKGMGIPSMPFLDRAASVENGRTVYVNKCRSCHGDNGQGVSKSDSSGFIYPPLWGARSYNISAGIYQLSRLAGFIKYNMPYTTVQIEPQLLDEEAWDVAAYISSQDRPKKLFSADWPDIAKKPFDYPFGPYTDGFTEQQHKYGPFDPIKKAKAGK